MCAKIQPDAEGRIRTGGLLRDETLILAPLTVLGYLRASVS